LASTEVPAELAEGSSRQRPLRGEMTRHVVIVLVGRLDRSLTRALRYGRALRPAALRCVHVALDPTYAQQLAREWERVGLGPIPLEIKESPARDLVEAVLEVARAEVAEPDTQVTLVVPRRIWRPWLAMVTHDRTAASLVREVTSQAIDHLTVTVTPFIVRS
jgi:hypothetical protein